MRESVAAPTAFGASRQRPLRSSPEKAFQDRKGKAGRSEKAGIMGDGERFFHALIEGLYESVAVLSEDTTILYASPSFERMTGFHPEELVGKSALDYVHPGDLEPLVAKFSSLVGLPGETYTHSFRFRHKLGGYRHAEATGRNLLHDPEVRGIVVNLHDVTERTEADQALRDSEERFRVLTEQSVMGIFIVKDDEVIYANQAVSEITGYTLDEFLSLPKGGYASLVFPEDRSFVLEQARLKQSGLYPQVPRYTTRFFHKNGDIRHVELFSKTVYLKSEPAVMVVMTDVTERESARDTLEQVVRLFLNLGAHGEENISLILRTGRRILDMPFAVYLRLDGREVMHHVDPDAALWQLLDPLRCEPLLRLLARDPDEPLIARDLSERAPPGGAGRLVELGIRSMLGRSVAARDEVVGALCFLGPLPRDFKRREVEVSGMLARALAVEEERFSHQRNLKDFVDIVSHEIRHPMTILRGYSQLLSTYRDRLDPELEAEILENIPNAVERMESLVSELVDVSKIDRARLAVVKKDFDPVPLLERAVDEMRLRFPRRPFNLSHRLKGTIHADPERLLEVLLILLENAAKYSPPASPVDVEAEVNEDEFLASVLDRGPGVPVEERTRIFERFYQVEDVNHHSIPGIGLGLYIAREIVEGHGGRIWCAEREGGGSAFRFAVPL